MNSIVSTRRMTLRVVISVNYLPTIDSLWSLSSCSISVVSIVFSAWS